MCGVFIFHCGIDYSTLSVCQTHKYIVLKPNSLVGELRFIKIRRLDEGQTEINEKVEANGAESVNHYRGCNCVLASLTDHTVLACRWSWTSPLYLPKLVEKVAHWYSWRGKKVVQTPS